MSWKVSNACFCGLTQGLYKNLVRGTSIYDDLVQRGLLKKYSHALVIMYAKCSELGKTRHA